MPATKRTSMRLPDEEIAVLDFFAQHFLVDRTAVMRQLIRQASLDSFPPSWHQRIKELKEADNAPIPDLRRGGHLSEHPTEKPL